MLMPTFFRDRMLRAHLFRRKQLRPSNRGHCDENPHPLSGFSSEKIGEAGDNQPDNYEGRGIRDYWDEAYWRRKTWNFRL